MQYQVQPNKTLRHGDSRFMVRGTAMFGGLFVNFGDRPDFMQRGPTGGQPVEYGVSGEIMRAKLQAAYAAGVNAVRVSVEPAMLNVSGEIDMLDAIVAEASELGIVVSLTCPQPNTTQAQNITFWEAIATRYLSEDHVWINPKNEIGCTATYVNGVSTPNPNCELPLAWESEIAAYVSAIRGTGFLNPIVINPPGWGFRLDLAVPALLNNVTLKNDPNLIVGVHQYSGGAASFYASDLADTEAKWAQFLGQFCIINEELGICNFPGPLDPNLNMNPTRPSIDLPLWAKLQSWMLEHLEWLRTLDALSGVIGNNWEWYVPSWNIEDNNSMHRVDGSWSTWGQIFRDGWLSPAFETEPIALPVRTLSVGATGTTIANRTYRLVLSALESGGDAARLTFKGGASGTPPTIGSVHIGKKAAVGDAYDFAAAPTQVKFAGNSTITLPINGTIVSDVVPFVFSQSDTLVVSFTTQNNCNPAYGGNPNITEYLKSGADAATVNASGYGTEGGISVALSKIEAIQ